MLANREVAEGYYELRFTWPSGERPAPGSFLTIRAGGAYDPALRRPFAFSGYAEHGAETGGAEASIVYQLRGRGTAYLTRLGVGDPLDALGPLGKGFSAPARGTRPVLAAGGIGLGPMLYLARVLAADAAAGRCEAPILAMGFRSSAFVPSLPLPAGTAVCTDDGSSGFRGSVADWLSGFDPGLPPAYYACGPAPMMAAVERVAASRQAPFEAAVEQWMACGVGACADGPVLDGHAVAWEGTL